jgi:translation initiation factor IF-3
MVGESVEPKICSIDDAMKIANNLGLDLVEISPNVDPPVCKVIDYKKFIYDQKKKTKSDKKQGAKSCNKRIKVRPIQWRTRF